jgi:hypothetical protein
MIINATDLSSHLQEDLFADVIAGEWTDHLFCDRDIHTFFARAAIMGRQSSARDRVSI